MIDTSKPYAVVSIRKDATVKTEGMGYTGPSCEKVLEKVQAALGSSGSVEHKPEYYAQEQAQAFA